LHFHSYPLLVSRERAELPPLRGVRLARERHVPALAAFMAVRLLPPTAQSLYLAAQSFRRNPALPHWTPARTTVQPTALYPGASSHLRLGLKLLCEFHVPEALS
jgi:hypothetical protein